MEKVRSKVNSKVADRKNNWQRNWKKSAPIYNNDLFPSEILIKIFQHLPSVSKIRLERVCKKWQRASRNSWNKIEILRFLTPALNRELFQNFRKYFVAGTTKSVIIGTHDLRIIHGVLSRCGKYITDFALDYEYEQLPVRLPGGQFIKFTSDDPYRQMLSVIGRYCHNIRRLEIAQEACDLEELSDLLFKNKMLESVELCLTTDKIQTLSTKHLKCLSIQNDQDDCKNLIKVIKKAHVLEELDVAVNASMFRILRYKSSLKKLRLNYDHSAFDPDGLLNIAELINLESLAISWFSTVGGVGALRAISRNCKKLRELIFIRGEITREEFTIILNFPALESLELCSILDVTDDVISEIRVKRLVVDDHVTPLSEDAYISLIQNTNIVELDISDTRTATVFLRKLVKVVADRDRVLKIVVSGSIYREAVKTCEGCAFVEIAALKEYR